MLTIARQLRLKQSKMEMMKTNWKSFGSKSENSIAAFNHSVHD